MSVIVKGMKMPGTCAVCRFAGKGGYHMERVVCMFTGQNEDAENVDRLSDCPLVALPDKHGDLIDRQKLIEDNKHLEYPTDGKYRRDRAWAVGFNAGARHCNEHAVYAKTVIEAEDE